MALIDFTSYQEVRAALGVNTSELKDAIIALPLYAYQLASELEDVHPDIPAAYAAIGQIPELNRTRVQSRFYELVRMFSTYAAAKHFTLTLPLFSVKRIKDSDAESERNVDYYMTLREDIEGMLVSLRFRLGVAFGVVQPEAVPVARLDHTVLVLSPLAIDPVTGS